MARKAERLTGRMSSQQQKDKAREMLREFDINKKYTGKHFDKMLIPLYSRDGRPYMDEFEYTDAVFHNIEVEKLRKEYLSKKRK